MIDVLLMYPYANDITAKAAGLLPPLGLSYISSYIKKYGYTSEIIDCTGQGLTYSKIPTIISIKKPKVIGISSSTPIIHRAVELANLIKKTNDNILVVMGGIHASVLDEELLEEVDSVDIVVRGEGEETFREILEMHIKSRIKLQNIKGISYRDRGKIIINPQRDQIEDLDSIPFPSREAINNPYYRMPTKWNFKEPFATVVTSRGCPFFCKFCYVHKMFGRKVRFRSVDNIIEELKIIINKYGVTDIIFYDDTLTLNKKRIEKLCERIINDKLNISWGCYSRVNAIDEKIALKMKQAGCRMISFGVESGSNYMLKKMKKGITVSDSYNAIKICNKVKIETSVSVVVGFPGETKKTILETKKFLKRLSPLFVSIFRLIPYPGTTLFEDYLKQQGKKKLYINEFETIGERFLRIPQISDNDFSKAVYEIYIAFYASPKKLIDHLVRVFSDYHLIKGYSRAFLWILKDKMKF